MTPEPLESHKIEKIARYFLIAETVFVVLLLGLVIAGRTLGWGSLFILLVILYVPLKALAFAVPVLAIGGFALAIKLSRRGPQTFLPVALIVMSILFVAVPVFIYVNPECMMTIEAPMDEADVAQERYKVLSKRFEKPQRVESIHNLNSLVLDDDVRVYAEQPDELRRDFEAFAQEQLVGKKVTVRLPDRDVFLENYCCRASDRDIDIITIAEVYLDGQLLNDGGFLNIDTARR